MKLKNKKHRSRLIKKSIAAFFASLMLLQAADVSINLLAQQANKIRLSSKYGENYLKDLTSKNTNKAKTPAAPQVLKKDAVVPTTTSEYDGYEEVEEKRTSNSKTYELSPGYYVKEMFFEPIHKEENGVLVDIDNTLENTSKNRSTPIYENKNGLFDIKVQDKSIVLNNKANKVLELIQTNAEVSYVDVKENVVLYTKAYDNIDMEYIVSSNKVFLSYQINGTIALDTINYQVKLNGLTPKLEEEYIDFLDAEGNSVYKIVKPSISDANGSRGEASFSFVQLDADTIEVTNTLNQAWVNDTARIYPVKMNTRALDEGAEILEVKSSYVRSGSPNLLSSQYEDLFVGYDYENYGGAGSNIRIARAYLHIANPNLGANKLIISANLQLHKEQQDNLQWTTISAYKTQGYVDPYGLSWNTQPADGSLTHLSDTNVSGPVKQYYSFPITSYIADLNNGENKSIVLRASNESPAYTANVFNSESSGTLPKISVTYRDDYDVRPDLDINSVHANMFTFGKLDEGFHALSLDGIAKPDANVTFRLHEKKSDGTLAYIQTLNAMSPANKYFVNPIYTSNPIANTQGYPKPESNYTTDYVYDAGIPSFDTLYEYQVKVNTATESNVDTLFTDGFIKYKVKAGDNLKTIAAYYGVPINDIKTDNNLVKNDIKENQVLLVRFKKNNPQVSKDAYTPPLKTVNYEAKFVYRGPQCYGTCYVGDPINTSNGNFYHESEDFSLQDYDSLSFNRFYNSTGPQLSNMFGNGFTSNLEQYLTYDKDQNILFFRGDGKILQIKKDGAEYKVGKEDRIEYKRVGATYEIKDLETRNTYVFDDFGTLVKIINATGFETIVNYNEYGQIVSANMGGKLITFNYNDRKLVSSIALPSGASVSYQYDNKRNLTSFTDLNGAVETYHYDDNNFLTNITGKNGNKIADNVYDADGVVQSQKDGNGNQLNFDYNGNETKTTYADGTSFTYGFTNNKINQIQSDEGTSSYTYDALGNVKTKIDEAGDTTTYTYDKFNVTSIAYPDGTSERYEYNAANLPTMHVDAQGGIETFEYNGVDMVKNTKSNGTFTSFAYDGAHRVVSETNHLGASKSYTFAGNQIASVSHSNGLVESFAYDANGNVTQESDNQGSIYGYIYNASNLVTQKSYPDGTSEEWSYDGNGNIKQYKDRLGGLATLTYDKNNNPIKTSKGNFTTSKKYNVFDMVTSETNEQGLTTKFTYDSVGRKTQETDAYGNKTTFSYDELGQLIETTNAFDHTQTNTYENKQLVKTVDFNGQTTSYQYDDKNRETKKTNPNGTTETTEYSGLNISKKVDVFGNETKFTYDAYGRETKQVQQVGDNTITTTKTYDGYGNVLEEKRNDRTTTYTYDVHNRPSTTTDALGNVIKTIYDFDGNVTKEIDALGHVKETIYNGIGEVIKEIDKNGNVATKVFDTNSLLVSETDANGFTTTYDYNNKGQVIQTIDPYLTEIKFTYDNFNNVASSEVNGLLLEEKTYDDFGRLIETEGLSEHTTNEYDDFGQIIKTTNEWTGLTQETTYDVYGNVLSESNNNGKATSTEYDNYQRVIKETDELGRETTTRYDAAGDVVETRDVNGTTINEYDEDHNLVNTTNPLGLTTHATYDVLGRKATEKVDEKDLEYRYDAASQVIEVKDTNRNTSTKTVYDANGNAIEQTDALGNTSKQVFDGKGQVTKEIDAKGNETSTTYDANGNAIQRVDALNQTTQTTYNAFGLVSEEVDERGFTTTYTYNDKLQVEEIEDKLENVSTFTYNDANQVSKQSDANGNETTFKYDIAGNVIETIDGSGRKTTQRYDVVGNVIEERFNDRVTTTTYDDKGNVASIKINDKTTEQHTYNENNQLVKTVDALKHETLYQYDVFGNESEVNDKGFVTKKNFNVYGEELESIENGSYNVTNTYDEASRLIKQTTNGRVTLENTYDANGNVIKESNHSIQSEVVYDELNRAVELKQPSLDGLSMVRYETMNYDEAGNVIKTVDANGGIEEKTYDANNNVLSSTNKLGTTDLFAYDGLNNLIKVQNKHDRVVSYTYDASNQVTLKNINGKYASYTYDVYGNLTQEQNEYGYNHSYAYDVYGNQVTHTKPDGVVIASTYDANNNQSTKGDATFTYDKRGNVLTATNGAGTITYDYDAFDQITSVKDTNNKTVSYTYNADKEIKSILYPNATQVEYTYNNKGQLQDVIKNGVAIASYTFTNRGEVATLTQGSLTSTYTYDDMGRKTKQATTKDGASVYDATYAFDANDNLTSEVINGKTNTYTYNDAEELKESKKYIGEELVTTTYQYDLFGNKSVTSSKTGTTTYKYNDKGQLDKVEGTNGYTSYYYDNNGNIKNKVKANGSIESYQYDKSDRLIQMTQGAFIYDYAYDAQDERIQQVKTDIRDYPTKVWYDEYHSYNWEEQLVVKEKDVKTTFALLREQVAKKEANGGTCDETYADGYKLSKQKDATYKKKPETTIFTLNRNTEYTEVLLTNNETAVYSNVNGEGLLEESNATQIQGLNNTIVATAKGMEVNTINYTDYGVSDKIEKGHAYNGELQEDTGLIYLRARYYDPEVGTFIQIDNKYAGEQEEVVTQNRYTYALNNPYKYVDRDGEKVITGVKESWYKLSLSAFKKKIKNLSGAVQRQASAEWHRRKLLQNTSSSKGPIVQASSGVALWSGGLTITGGLTVTGGVGTIAQSTPWGLLAFSGVLLFLYATKDVNWLDHLGSGGVQVFNHNGTYPINSYQGCMDMNKAYQEYLAKTGQKTKSNAKANTNTNQTSNAINHTMPQPEPPKKPEDDKDKQGSGDKYKFGNDDLLDQHYQKHVVDQNEFGSISKDQYLKQAQNATQNSNYSGIRSNGDSLYYNSTSNEFVVTTPNNVIRTYFKPKEGLQYYLREIAK